MSCQVRDRNTGEVVNDQVRNPPLEYGGVYIVTREHDDYTFVAGDVFIAHQDVLSNQPWRLLSPNTGRSCLASGYQSNDVGFRRLRDNEELVITNNEV